MKLGVFKSQIINVDTFLTLQVLQQLPDKIDLIEKVTMDDAQQRLYDGLRTEFTVAVRKAGGEAIQGKVILL